jgi:lipase
MAGPRLHTFGPTGGRPLLALHGMRGYGGRWWHLAATQLPDFRVYAPDLRGHGHSPDDPPWTLELFAADVLAILDTAGLDRVDVLAHSFGGAVAVHLSRLAPARVRRLVLLDPAVTLPPAVARAQALSALEVPTFDDPAHAIAARRLYWPPAAHDLAEREVTEHLVLTEGERWRWRYNPAVVVTAFSELARPAVSPPPGTPTLLVRATRSRLLPQPYLSEWRAALGADLSMVELDCGHQVHLELPERTGALVRAFLS